MTGAAGLEARRYPRAALATPHYLASAAGAGVLARGGNAVDAVVAANLALGVVSPYYCGYGGDLFAIVWDGELHGYRSAGRSPAAATVAGVRESEGTSEMPVLGAHTVTVPGAVRGWFALLDRWGSRSFAELAADALAYAEDGHPVTARGSRSYEGCRALYAGFDALLAAYPPDATGPGAWLRQPALGRTIRRLAEGGPDEYYGGAIGAAIADAVQAEGGSLALDDLAAHEDAWVTPLRGRFGPLEVCELPPPTQGVTALEALRIADGLDLGVDGPDRHHLLIEAAKLALADRDAHVSDPAAMRVAPEALLAEARIARRRADIDPERASTPVPRPAADGGTAYLCAADADGLAVSLIQSNFLAMGSGLHVAEWGINLQNRGSSFVLDPEHVNSFAPAKLPMHTLVPALALRDGAPHLVFGTMGGHGQAQTHLQLLTRLVVDDAEVQAAVSAPRWAVDPGTWLVAAERRFDPAWIEGLAERGHRVRSARAYDDGMGHAHAIVVGDGLAVATDPRAEGAAIGR